MINGSISRHSLFAALWFSLAACGSSDPETARPNENAADAPDTSLPADQPTPPEPDNTATPPASGEDPDSGPVVGEPPSNDPVDTPDDTDVTVPDSEQQDPPSTPLTPPPAPGANPDNQPPGESAGDPVQVPSGDGSEPVEQPSEPGEQPSEPVEQPSDSSDPVEQPGESNPPLIGGPPSPGGLPVTDDPPSTDPTPLIPPVDPGSDLDQLIRGLTREASAAILFLNAQISQGSVTADQNDCLGTYEPGSGRQLAGFDCENQYLDRDSSRILLTQAAFFDTADCQASLFNANSEGCILEKLSMAVPADWSEAPSLGYPGAQVNFAIGDTSLRIDSDDQALSGMFACEINLETALPVRDAGTIDSCDSVVSRLADEIDRLQDR